MRMFIHRPIEVLAEQFNGEDLLEGMDWDMGGAYVKTHESGPKYVLPGQWIVKHPDGVYFDVMSDEEFKFSYLEWYSGSGRLVIHGEDSNREELKTLPGWTEYTREDIDIYEKFVKQNVNYKEIEGALWPLIKDVKNVQERKEIFYKHILDYIDIVKSAGLTCAKCSIPVKTDNFYFYGKHYCSMDCMLEAQSTVEHCKKCGDVIGTCHYNILNDKYCSLPCLPNESKELERGLMSNEDIYNRAMVGVVVDIPDAISFDGKESEEKAYQVDAAMCQTCGCSCPEDPYYWYGKSYCSMDCVPVDRKDGE